MIDENKEVAKKKLPTKPTPATTTESEQYQPVTQKDIDGINEKIRRSDRMMDLIIAVLFVGFITLIFSLGAILIQVFGFNADIQKDLIKAIDMQTESNTQLQKNVDSINSYFQNNSTNSATQNENAEE